MKILSHLIRPNQQKPNINEMNKLKMFDNLKGQLSFFFKKIKIKIK
jgi:hypothetical protein